MKGRKDIVITLWNAIGIIIVLGFFMFSIIIGGSAGLGYEENGRFFVQDHAEIVEVSEMLWQISSVWEILFWIFIILTPIGDFIIAYIRDRTKKE